MAVVLRQRQRRRRGTTGRPRLDDEQARRRKDTYRRAELRHEKEQAARKIRQAVVRKRLIISRNVLRKACENLVPDYDPWKSSNGFRFDDAAAAEAIRFFNNKLSHVKGDRAKTGFRLERWQWAVIGNLFGWKDDRGYRRYTELFLYVPRKNGKTPLAAGIITYLLFEDREPGAEIYGAAATYKQAGLLWEHAQGMVRACPELESRAKIFRGQAKAIQLNNDSRNVDDLSIYSVISSEHTEGHAMNLHAAVIDELHLQPDRALLDSLVSAMASESRKQPLLICISTADYDREESVCNEKLKYARRIRDNPSINPRFLPVIYETAPEEDWTDEAVWDRVNPNIDVSVSREFLRQECRKAQEIPAYENAFKRLHLNMPTKSDVLWLPMDKWDQGNQKLDLRALAGQPCYGGLDLALTKDTTAFVLVFPRSGGCFDVLPFFWVPETDARRREKQDRVPYLGWAAAGHMELTPGDVTDYRYIRRRINELGRLYKIQEIAYDPWNATQLATELSEQDGLKMVEFRQGFKSMQEPSKTLERLILAGRIRHGGHPVLRSHASCVAVAVDPAGGIKPDKKHSTDRIDGIVALIMGLGRAAVSVKRTSAYRNRGVRLV